MFGAGAGRVWREPSLLLVQDAFGASRVWREPSLLLAQDAFGAGAGTSRIWRWCGPIRSQSMLNSKLIQTQSNLIKTPLFMSLHTGMRLKKPFAKRPPIIGLLYFKRYVLPFRLFPLKNICCLQVVA